MEITLGSVEYSLTVFKSSFSQSAFIYTVFVECLTVNLLSSVAACYRTSVTINRLPHNS